MRTYPRFPQIRGVLDLTEELLTTFGFKDYEINLSTRPEKSVGSDEASPYTHHPYPPPPKPFPHPPPSSPQPSPL